MHLKLHYEGEDMEEYKNKLLQILQEINPYEEIKEDTELIETGLLDSMSILVLVTELEEEYGIIIDEKLIVPERFVSVHAIEELLEQLRGE